MASNQSRRSFVTAVAAAALAGPALAGTGNDSELVALCDQVIALRAEANKANEAMEALQPEIDRLIQVGRHLYRDWRDLADEVRESTGWEAHCTRANDLLSEADVLVRRMWDIKATSDVGRQAKVRVLYAHCVARHNDWESEIGEEDWGVDMARRLLAEFAGMPQTA